MLIATFQKLFLYSIYIKNHSHCYSSVCIVDLVYSLQLYIVSIDYSSYYSSIFDCYICSFNNIYSLILLMFPCFCYCEQNCLIICGDAFYCIIIIIIIIMQGSLEYTMEWNCSIIKFVNVPLEEIMSVNFSKWLSQLILPIATCQRYFLQLCIASNIWYCQTVLFLPIERV